MDLALSPAHSPRHVEALVTLDFIATQLNNIQLNIDTMMEKRYEDRNELVSYINDLQHMLNETVDYVEGLWHQLQCTNDHLHDLEIRVEHIDYHLYECTALFFAPLAFPPNPPP